MNDKVCAVLLRGAGADIEILAFEHPLAGCQLVKGTIEAGESVEAAAVRELREESGIASARVLRTLGTWNAGFQGQVWTFVECTTPQALADHWTHQAPDDGGHAFRFFWQPLAAEVDPEHWHVVYREALKFIEGRLKFRMC